VKKATGESLVLPYNPKTSMIAPFLFCVAFFLTDGTPRSWPEVLRVAATNYFALFALGILLVGFWLLFRAKGWVKAAGALAILAGAALLVMVLRDIKREILSRRDAGQQSLVTGQ
jgi:hypothetical protein